MRGEKKIKDIRNDTFRILCILCAQLFLIYKENLKREIFILVRFVDWCQFCQQLPDYVLLQILS